MKKLKCDICDHVAEGETFEDWMNALKPHYAKEHSEFMEHQSKRSKDEQMTEMQKWETENRKRFEEA